MELSIRIEGTICHIDLSGELDHHAANDARKQIDGVLLPDTSLTGLYLNLSGVTFMDSSGIAVVLHLHRRMREVGGTLHLSHVPPQAKRVFDAAGISKMVAME